jgi:restriction endonuclease S subunit
MAVFTGDYLAIPSAYLIRLRFSPLVYVDYIHLFLKSPHGQSELGLSTTKVAQPNINAKSLRAMYIPLPPANEQQRIIAKLRELMALCDQLEAQLATTRKESQRLLEAILVDALASLHSHSLSEDNKCQMAC